MPGGSLGEARSGRPAGLPAARLAGILKPGWLGRPVAGAPGSVGGWQRGIPKQLTAWKLGEIGFDLQFARTDHDCPWRITSGRAPHQGRWRTSRGTGTSPRPARRPAPQNGPAGVQCWCGGVEVRLGRPVALRAEVALPFEWIHLSSQCCGPGSCNEMPGHAPAARIRC